MVAHLVDDLASVSVYLHVAIVGGPLRVSDEVKVMAVVEYLADDLASVIVYLHVVIVGGPLRVSGEVKVTAVVAHFTDDLGQRARRARRHPFRTGTELSHVYKTEEVSSKEDYLRKENL